MNLKKQIILSQSKCLQILFLIFVVLINTGVAFALNVPTITLKVNDTVTEKIHPGPTDHDINITLRAPDGYDILKSKLTSQGMSIPPSINEQRHEHNYTIHLAHPSQAITFIYEGKLIPLHGGGGGGELPDFKAKIKNRGYEISITDPDT